MKSLEPAQEPVRTRRSLITRLKQWDDQEGWQEFFDTYWKLIYSVALRAGLSETEAEDIVQETIVSVAHQMPNFRYDPERGSFKSWLFLITRRRISDHLRKVYRRVKIHQAAPGETSRTTLLERAPDPASENLDTIWDEEWKRRALEEALNRVKSQVGATHFQIFDCYVRKNWPVKDVVKAFGIRAGQVYLIKHRVSALLTQELKKIPH
jgi:RNA polymerase sigma-70 factor (ECF subfamily)